MPEWPKHPFPPTKDTARRDEWESFMWRLMMTAGLVLILASGCEVVVPAETAAAAAIPSVQFLRPVRDSATNTWVAAWLDPDGFSGADSQTADQL